MKTTEQFIREVKEKWNLDLDYSNVEYINSRTPIILKCKIHNITFSVVPAKHLNRGDGCPKCRYEKAAKNNPNKLTTEQFVKRAKKIHGDKYDYSLTNYINARTKVVIICKKHGEFKQLPKHHLNDSGCPVCSSSHGEETIRNFLIENNIIFEEQKRFKECKKERELPFDFYIPETNTLIEFQGEQHYIPVEHFGGEEHLKIQKENDNLKREFCLEYNYELLELNKNNLQKKLNLWLRKKQVKQKK